MSKTAFVFPGQGSQSVGMAKSFHDSFDAAKKTFDEAGEVMGLDMAKLVFEGPEELLNRTEYTQPALLTASIATLRVLYEKTGFRPAFLAGHSLGEYTALVAAGALDFREAVRL
ncbi:partial Malonyl CoA-acyl carrier protein transacylase, partial [uncultured bacterium]